MPGAEKVKPQYQVRSETMVCAQAVARALDDANCRATSAFLFYMILTHRIHALMLMRYMAFTLLRPASVLHLLLPSFFDSAVMR